MKRLVFAICLFLPALGMTHTVDALPEAGTIAPIAYSDAAAQTSCQPAGCTPRQGTVFAQQYLGVKPGAPSRIWNQLMSGNGLPVEVCDSVSCETVIAGANTSTESNTSSYILSGSIPVPTSKAGHLVTIAFPKDLDNPSAGFGLKSNSVDTSKSRLDGVGEVSGRPLMEITYGNLFSSEINNVGVCFNNDGSGLFVPRDEYGSSDPTNGISNLDRINLSGYQDANYSLLDGTTEVQAGSLVTGMNAPLVFRMGGGMCKEYSGGTVFPYKRFSGLTGGTIYKLIYTISGPGKKDIVGTLKFLTPNGCPTSDVGDLTGPLPYAYMAINTEGRLLYPTGSMFPNSSLKELLGIRVAPVYVTATKNSPYNNRNEADWPNMWKYVPEFDDWAKNVDGQVVITRQTIISATLYAQCAPTSLNVTVTALTEAEAHAKQFCIVENGQVIPTGDGPCLLKVVVSRVIATKAGVRKMGTPTVLKVPFTIGSFDATAAGVAGRVRACSFNVTTKSSPNLAKKVVPCSKLSVKKGQTSLVTVVTESKSICQVKAGLLKKKSSGSCLLNVSVKKGKKVLSTQKVIVEVL